MKATAHQEFTKEFVASFIEIAQKHRSISTEEYFAGMHGRVLLDFAFALGIADEVLARHPLSVSSEESSNALVRDLAASILEKVGR